MILGGAGSLTGVLIGAILINVTFEILTPATPGTARVLFFVVILAALVWKFRPWYRLLALLGGVVVFGVVVHALAGAVSDNATAAPWKPAGAPRA